MSYSVAAALQRAVYFQLQSDAVLAELVGGAIYDAVPTDVTGSYVTLGPEQVADASDQTGRGAVHDFVVTVMTDEASFAHAKAIAAATSDALDDADLVLERGHLVGLWFMRAQARRVDKTSQRRIDMTFRARVGV